MPADAEDVQIELLGRYAEAIDQLFAVHPAARRIGNASRGVLQSLAGEGQEQIVVASRPDDLSLFSERREDLDVLLVLRHLKLEADVRERRDTSMGPVHGRRV